MNIPENLLQEYPFKSHYINVSDKYRLHYVDEGDGDPILMVHGNPTWSFTFRNLIKEFKKNSRVVVPDHIGCGLSDKPQNYSYQLKDHIDNLETLVNHLGLKNITLIVHDWGGAIGFGLATRAPENIKKIVILNTAAFRSSHIPFRINLCRFPFLGDKLIRHFNAFAWAASFMAVTKKLSPLIKEGYLLPYNNYENRIATSRFVQDIPMEKNHPSYGTIKTIEENLKNVTCPKLILWGGQDFCFNDHFFNRWKEIYPKAENHYFETAGHYVMEDAKKEVISKTKSFLEKQ